MPDDPTPGDARVLAARAGDLTVASIYAVNGKEVGDPAYEVKLAWYDALHDWARGTFDVDGGGGARGRLQRDPRRPRRVRPRCVARTQPGERARARATADARQAGFIDLGRLHAGEGDAPYTFWDYRMGAFHRGWGLRLDLALGTAAVAGRLASVAVDRDERKPTSGEGKPSDHAPLIVTLHD